jgi:hypothetical protein
VGDTQMTAFVEDVPSIAVLPLSCQHGKRLRVVGETKNPIDDYYIEFVAELGSGFGPGTWKESIGYAVPTSLNQSTMPHQLVRKQDDGSGTVTGVPYQIFFEWGPATWDERLAGDLASNPNPSFVGYEVISLSFYQNRLGLTSRNNLVFSQVGEYFNYFRTTVQTLPDDDRVDTAVPHTRVSTLYNCIPFSERLVALSDETQFIVLGEPISADEIAVKPVLESSAQTAALPVVLRNTLYFAGTRGEFTSVNAMVPSRSSESRFDSEDITAAIPQYIKGRLIQLSGSTQESVMFAVADDEPGMFFGYHFFDTGADRLQSAWFKYVIGEDPVSVRGIVFIGHDAYLAVQRTSGLFIERMQIGSGRVDEESTYITHLDRRVDQAQVTMSYSGITNRTTITLPYTLEVGSDMAVVTKLGASLTILSTTTTTVVVSEDQTDTELWVGQNYTARYRFSQPVYKQDSGRGRAVVPEGRLQVLRGFVVYANTATFAVEVTPIGRETKTKRFTASDADVDAEVGPLLLADGTFPFAVLSKSDQVQVDLVNDGPFPSSFQAGSWMCEFSPKSQPTRG